MERRVHHLLEQVLRPSRTRLTSINSPNDTKGGAFRPVEAGATPGTPGSTTCHQPEQKRT